MASTHVALIRGINVGRAKRVAMADLRGLMARLGYADGRTLLNSGNLAFGAPPGAEAGALAAELEAALPAAVGVAARVTVLSTGELAAVLAESPWPEAEADPSRLLVSVWRDAADRAAVEPLAARDWGADWLALGTRAAYAWCREGVLASELPAAVGRALGDRVTTRTWATMGKLHALARS